MPKYISFNAAKDARENVISEILTRYHVDILGVPPQTTRNNKLFGATPPNMESLTKLFKK